MSAPERLRPARLLEFVHRPGASVIHLWLGPTPRFNQALPRWLSATGVRARFARVGLFELLRKSPATAQHLFRALLVCDAPSRVGVLPGYYLFDQGELLTWESGLLHASEAKDLVRHALSGAMWTALTRTFVLSGGRVEVSAEDVVARRIALTFLRALSARRRVHEHKTYASSPPPAGVGGELGWAYALLEVAPGASDREVKQAWRRRRVENHPDLFAHDPEERARRTHLSADLNRAWDVIRTHRDPTRAGKRPRSAP